MDIYENKLNNYLKNNGQPLSQESKNQYLRMIKLLVDKHGFDWRVTELEKYTQQFELPTQLNYINAVINYFTVMGFKQNIINKYKKYKDSLSILKEETPVINPKKEQHLAEWQEILEWRNKVSYSNKSKKNPSYAELMTELILHLYTSFPRRNEIADLHYITVNNLNDIPDNNLNLLIYDLKTNIYILKFIDYKTNGTYGTQTYEINANYDYLELHKLIKSFIIKNDNREILFYSPRDKTKPLTRLNLTKLLQRSSKKYMDKSISRNSGYASTFSRH